MVVDDDTGDVRPRPETVAAAIAHPTPRGAHVCARGPRVALRRRARIALPFEPLTPTRVVRGCMASAAQHLASRSAPDSSAAFLRGMVASREDVEFGINGQSKTVIVQVRCRCFHVHVLRGGSPFTSMITIMITIMITRAVRLRPARRVGGRTVHTGCVVCMCVYVCVSCDAAARARACMRLCLSTLPVHLCEPLPLPVTGVPTAGLKHAMGTNRVASKWDRARAQQTPYCAQTDDSALPLLARACTVIFQPRAGQGGGGGGGGGYGRGADILARLLAKM